MEEDNRATLARIEERVEALRREMIQHEKISDQRIALAAGELARRLEGLNGEAERLASMQATYVNRETAEMQHAGFDHRILALERYQSNLDGKQWIGGAIILVLAAIVAMVAGSLKI